METQREQQRLLSALLKIQHGDLAKFYAEVHPTAEKEPNLFGHALAWNQAHGRVRDSKVAFPVIALRTEAMTEDDFAQNAVAHLALLGPRDLVKAYNFSKLCTASGAKVKHGRHKLVENMLQRYLEVREKDRQRWDATVLRNRTAMLTLYTVAHARPSTHAQAVLFDKAYPGDSVFAKVRDLKRMDPMEQAAVILKYRVPYTVVAGAEVGLDNPNVLLALIQTMTANELITAAKKLSKLDAFKLPIVQDMFNEATGKASKDKRVNVLKATKAAAAAPTMAKALAKVKEAAADSLAKIPGDWLVLADRSPSMHLAIEAGKQLAGLLAHRVEGKVHLIFFDSSPLSFDVTGKSLDEIEKLTKHITTGSATSIGCGLRTLREKKALVDGIVLISDGEENTPPHFPQEYKALENEPALYFVKMRGGADNLGERLVKDGIPFTMFDVREAFDYSAMVNVVSVLKPTTYGFLEEVMETPLLTLDEVFSRQEQT